MTAIVGRVAAEGTGAGEGTALVRRALVSMSARGSDMHGEVVMEAACLGAACFSWEPAAREAAPREVAPREAALREVAPAAIHHRADLAIAADATLYYQGDLRRTLARAGVGDAGDSAAALILAAYEALGEACVEHLEGDFAFVLWDARRGRMFAARDFGGRRPLYFAAGAHGLTVASTLRGVLADERVSGGLNVARIAAVAAGLWCHSDETCLSAVSELGAGFALTWERGRGARTARYWRPPSTIAPTARRDNGDAAHELLELLSRATRERLAPAGPTAVSLSGGWDSTAVFAAGNRVLCHDGARAQSLRPVSISYPRDDPGFEDDLINAVTAFWDTATAWIEVDGIPMFGDFRAAARERDDPFAHPYEAWNRALSRTAQREGARVILDGSGGDQLFQVSDVYLADLLRAGRLGELARQWRTRSQRGARDFLRSAVRPRLSPGVLRALARVRGYTGTPPHYLERSPPAWCRREFFTQHGVLEAERAASPVLPTSSAVLAETHGFLLFRYFARVSGLVGSFSLAEGVEQRSPLLDSRVVSFAASRPWYDRVDGRETKVLLRRAVRGLLPDQVLAARPHRTGVTSGYFERSMRGPGREFASELLGCEQLADLGVIEPGALRRAWDYYLRSSNSETGVRIYFTLQTELWLRAQGRGARHGAPLPETARSTGAA